MSIPVAEGPQPITTFLDATGTPLAGGLIYTYAAGTNTPQPTYSDYTGTVQNSNPVVLDSAGRAQIWFIASAYKIVVCDANNSQQYVVDGFSVGLFANGNNSFTGNNTFAGSTTFNGAVIINNGGALNGTFTGNPNFSGTPTFTNATFSGNIQFPAGISVDSIAGITNSGLVTMSIEGQPGSATSNGQPIAIIGGEGGVTNGIGGSVTIESGQGQGTAGSGNIQINPQTPLGSGIAGNTTLSAGNAGTTQNGGNLALIAGNAGAGNANGGNISLTTGTPTGTGITGIATVNGITIPYFYSNVSPQTVANTTVETTLFTVQIPANAFQVNQILRMMMNGFRSSASGDGSSLEYRVRIDGVQIVAGVDDAAITTTDRGWSFETSFGLNSLGASAHLFLVGGKYIYYPDGTDGVVTPVTGGNSSGYVSFNTLVSHVLTITAQWSSGVTASESTTATMVLIE